MTEKQHSNVATEGQKDKAVIIPLILIPKRWKEFLTEYEYKVVIANGLNYCVAEHKLIILGYLINTEKIHIVLRIKKADLKKMLLIFAAITHDFLQKHFSALGKKGVPFLPFRSVFETDHIHTHLFEEYVFEDELLIQLLTGNARELTGYHPGLEQTKKWLRSCDFCSFNDHSGAIGQVILNK